MADTIDIRPGFADPVIDSQRVFRTVLEAMSRPGRIGILAGGLQPPAPLATGAAAICLALADHDTPLWLAPELHAPEAIAFLKFHCGCPIVSDPAKAAFAIAAGTALPRLDRFALGDDAWPETSTTVIVQVEDLATDGPLSLTGPGIETVHRLRIQGLRGEVWNEWADNRVLFPRGIDLVLVTGDRIVALPRTTAATMNAED